MLRPAENRLHNLGIIHHGRTDEGCKKNGLEALEHALKAVTSAAGIHYEKSHNITELTKAANTAEIGDPFSKLIGCNTNNWAAKAMELWHKRFGHI